MRPIKFISRKLVLALAAAVLALVGYYIFFFDTFLYAGTLEATRVDLSSQLASSVATVEVHEGDKVVAGQRLVVLKCEDYLSDARLATHNYERNHRLFLKSAISKDTLDQFLNKKEEAEIHVNWCVINSPIAGTVLSRYREPGEYVTQGQKLLTLANIKDVWAYIYVPQTELAKLKVGQTVIGFIPELKNRKFSGKITKINSESEFTPKNVQTRSERTRLVFGVKVSFLAANEEEILKPGMTIEVKIPKD